MGRWVHVALSDEAAARHLLEALWPLMVSAESELARDRAEARALRCEVCDPNACPVSNPAKSMAQLV